VRARAATAVRRGCLPRHGGRGEPLLGRGVYVCACVLGLVFVHVVALHHDHRAPLDAVPALGRRARRRTHALSRRRCACGWTAARRRTRACLARRTETSALTAAARSRAARLDEVGRSGAHSSARARRTESMALKLQVTSQLWSQVTHRSRANPRQSRPQSRYASSSLPRVLRQPDIERAVGDGAIQCIEVVAHELVKRGRLRTAAKVFGGTSGTMAISRGGGGRVHARAPARDDGGDARAQ